MDVHVAGNGDFHTFRLNTLTERLIGLYYQQYLCTCSKNYTRVLHLAFTFIQARGRCTTPPSLAPSPLKLEGAAPPPPPALLVSSSCTTHHPLPQSLPSDHGRCTAPPSCSHSMGGGAPLPPPSCPHPRLGGCAPPSPPQLCPSKVGGGAPPPPPPPLQGERSFVHFKIDSGEEESRKFMWGNV